MIKEADKADFWRHHQRSWQVSGLSQKAYCQQHKLSYHVFVYWRVRQKDATFTENTLPSVVPVHIEHNPRCAPDAPAIEIHFGSAKVILPHSVPAHYVSDMLKALV
jgi:hypothetical protein